MGVTPLRPRAKNGRPPSRRNPHSTLGQGPSRCVGEDGDGHRGEGPVGTANSRSGRLLWTTSPIGSRFLCLQEGGRAHPGWTERTLLYPTQEQLTNSTGRNPLHAKVVTCKTLPVRTRIRGLIPFPTRIRRPTYLRVGPKDLDEVRASRRLSSVQVLTESLCVICIDSPRSSTFLSKTTYLSRLFSSST